jgi:hypothetical protein
MGPTGAAYTMQQVSRSHRRGKSGMASKHFPRKNHEPNKRSRHQAPEGNDPERYRPICIMNGDAQPPACLQPGSQTKSQGNQHPYSDQMRVGGEHNGDLPMIEELRMSPLEPMPGIV